MRSVACRLGQSGMLFLAVLSFFHFSCRAHETDNFNLSLDHELADLGDFLETVHTRVIEDAVAEVNTKIERALAIRDEAAQKIRLEEYHSPDAIASAVASRFGDAVTETFKTDRALHGTWTRRAFPGKQAAHKGIWMNFAAHWLIDPRALVMFSQADTIKAFGVYFGTDKLTHFHQLGWGYYQAFRKFQGEGLNDEEAYRKVLHHYGESGFLAEGNVFGTIGTGVYSNADMFANHIGFKFFLNLTQKVVLKEKEREPLVVRCGVFWRVNDYVRPQSGWLEAFVSDHWNEALNPNLYDGTMRSGIRHALQKHADRIIRFYTEKDGRPNDAQYFENLARELSTYNGEAYGHSGQFEHLMNIGNTCFPAVRGRAASSPAMENTQ